MADRAPERIWLRIRYGSILQYGLDGNFECGPSDDRQIGTEYVRADLVPSPPAISGEAKWYVGTMNDAVFIIDTPPRRNPDAWLNEGDPNTNVIAALGAGAKETCAIAEKIVAEHNKAASLVERQGREIATNIAVLEENVATMAEAKSVIGRLSRELAEARAALETAHEQLTRPEWGSISYMEGSEVYGDLQRAAKACELALASRNPADGERR